GRRERRREDLRADPEVTGGEAHRDGHVVGAGGQTQEAPLDTRSAARAEGLRRTVSALAADGDVMDAGGLGREEDVLRVGQREEEVGVARGGRGAAAA